MKPRNRLTQALFLSASLLFLAPSTSRAQQTLACGLSLHSEGFQKAWVLHLALNHQPYKHLLNTQPPLWAAIVSISANDGEDGLRYLRAAQSQISARSSNNEIAEIAYWASKAWTQLHRPDMAAKSLSIARRYPDTFYGLLSGADPKSAAHIQDALTYPAPDFRYIDRRTEKALVLAVIRQESRFHIHARSTSNAFGLMQIIHGTAASTVQQQGFTLDANRLYNDPHYNVAIGTTYLGTMLSKYSNNIPLALAAYNAGPGCADRWQGALGDPSFHTIDGLLWVESIPYKETREYIKAVLANYQIYLQKLKTA